MRTRSGNRAFSLGFIFFMLLISTKANAGVLPVPLVAQEQNQWCWAGTTKCIINYYGISVSQCQIAEYTRTQADWHDFGSVNCCTNPNQGCNYWNYLYGSGGSVQDILAHWSLESQIYDRELYLSEISTAINDKRPFLMRWGWTSGGGHFLVGHGLQGGNVYYMDPWPGEGFKIGTYTSVVSGSDHAWTHTAVVTTAFVENDCKLTIQSSAWGTTTPSPGVHYYILNSNVQVTANPATYACFTGWTGNVSGTNNPVTVLMNQDKTIKANFHYIHAPTGVSGEKVLNRSFSQAEYIDNLSWQNNSNNSGLTIASYKIYSVSGSVKTLLAEVNAPQTTYVSRNAGKGVNQYAVAAVTSGGREGASTLVTVQ